MNQTLSSPRTETAPARTISRLRVGGSVGFDWIMALLAGWLVGGLYLDGWAHVHIPQLETFFTPWHAVLYSGYGVLAGALTAVFLINRRPGGAWREALPSGYGLSLCGAGVFAVGGMGDMLWHIAFGVENDVEALLSPTHLILALGGGLMISGPLRAGLRREDREPVSGWRRMPSILSLTLVLSVVTFFTEYASPFATTWPAVPTAAHRDALFINQALGMASVLIQAAVLSGLVLPLLARRPFPLGGFTLVLGLNVLLMTAMHQKHLETGMWPLVIAALVAGVGLDAVGHWARPRRSRPGSYRIFAFLLPAVLYVCYFLAVAATGRLRWSVHLWTGAVVVAGAVGLFFSYLLVPRVPSRGATSG